MQIAPGFYYHYKHDPEGPVNNYAYEVLGVGCHTEIEEGSAGRFFVVYRPLYESGFYKDGKMFALRPYEMFTEQVTLNGNQVPRFRLIDDEGVVKVLREHRDSMYPQ